MVVTAEQIVAHIRELAETLGRPPSRAEFQSRAGIREYHVLKHFDSWNDAVSAAGLSPNVQNQPVDPELLLKDWGELVRKLGKSPPRSTYRKLGRFSPGTFDKKFGQWSLVPAAFQQFASGRAEWSDVAKTVALAASSRPEPSLPVPRVDSPRQATSLKLTDRQTYGDPIDFRGLRHAPVNEQGVVFLFGIVARELGYLVEAVQQGFPDCEAKRQIRSGQWQRVRIEFEFESRNFADHGHSPDGCDVIVCWRDNWAERPDELEVLELSKVLARLSP